jgi:cold shock CspA family protein
LEQQGGRAQVEVGMEVSFDLSLQMLTNHLGGRGGGRGKPNNIRSPPEKESLRARRVQILPKGTVKEKISVAKAVKAIVTKEDQRQKFVGMLELEESITLQNSNLRYPYVSKLLDFVSAGKYGDHVTFHDVLSEKDAQVVTSMVNARDDLKWSYVPLEGENVDDSHHRKLCISRQMMESADIDESESHVLNDTVGREDSTTIDVESSDSAQVEASDVPTEGEKDGEKNSDSNKKKKSKKEKVIKNLRFDKYSFPELSIGPLCVGDVLSCDLYISRSSGQVYVENINVIERNERTVPSVTQERTTGKENVSAKKNLTGYVTEVVPNRQFGFINGIDESGSKTGDHVFFHFNAIKNGDDSPQDASPSAGKAKKFVKSDVIRKGDEVKFDAEPGKNGKLTATTIVILPRGTLKLPPKVDKSTCCTGYILLEPSHTSLANTPSHIILHSGPSLDGAGRWDNVGKEDKTSHTSGSNVKEEGVILLLTDPSHLFSPKPPSQRKSSIDDFEAETNNGNASSDEKLKSESDSSFAVESAVGTHVRYKLSSLAYRGPSDCNANRSDGPRRGDLVMFGKTKGNKLVKDIRIEKCDAATTVKGVLVEIDLNRGTAVFLSSENNTKYNISLSEVVSCEKSLLRENQEVNGVLHEGKIFGVCRTKDIFLTSSLAKNSSGSNNGPKQRPKLNLTVKKELQGMGGQIMAQSKMAKGPDGTIGFVHGWTKRLSPNAKTFIPLNIPDGGD